MSYRPDAAHPDEAISAYVDGAQSPAERARLEEHLGACERCRERVEDLRAIAEAALREEPPPVPSDLAGRINRRLSADRFAGIAAGAKRWRGAVSLAAGLMVASLVFLAVRRETPRPPRLPAAAPSSDLSRGPTQVPEKTSPAPAAKNDKAPAAATPKTRPAKGAEAEERRPTASSEPLPQASEALREESPAPVPPAPLAALPAGGTLLSSSRAQSLRSGEEKKEPAAGVTDQPSAAEAPRAKQARSADRERQNATADTGAAVSPREPSGPRSLLYETPETTITLSEEGTVTLVLRGFACSVSVTAPTAGDEAPSIPPELVTLFTHASSRELLNARSRKGSPAPSRAASEASPEKTLTLRDSEGDPLYTLTYGDSAESAPPRGVAQLEEEIRRVVYSRFRSALEERCGTIPGVPPGAVP